MSKEEKPEEPKYEEKEKELSEREQMDKNLDDTFKETDYDYEEEVILD